MQQRLYLHHDKTAEFNGLKVIISLENEVEYLPGLEDVALTTGTVSLENNAGESIYINFDLFCDVTGFFDCVFDVYEWMDEDYINLDEDEYYAFINCAPIPFTRSYDYKTERNLYRVINQTTAKLCEEVKPAIVEYIKEVKEND